MSIIIGQVEFEGPFSQALDIEEQPGIFGILCQTGEEFELIDLDESHNVRDCLISQEYSNNMLFYAETCRGTLLAIVHYTPQLTCAQRAELKYDLLSEFDNAAQEQICATS